METPKGPDGPVFQEKLQIQVYYIKLLIFKHRPDFLKARIYLQSLYCVFSVVIYPICYRNLRCPSEDLKKETKKIRLKKFTTQMLLLEERMAQKKIRKSCLSGQWLSNSPTLRAAGGGVLQSYF